MWPDSWFKPRQDSQICMCGQDHNIQKDGEVENEYTSKINHKTKKIDWILCVLVVAIMLIIGCAYWLYSISNSNY